MTPEEAETKVPAPTWLSCHLDQEPAEVLHRQAYLTGKKKRVLVMDAIMRTYGPAPAT